jgi:hypothetical protein
MIKRLVMITLALILMFVGIGGCDLIEELNYITVVVQAQACAKAEYWGKSSGVISWPGAQLNIEIIKAGGERVNFNKTTPVGGCADIVEGTFNVYKEQDVVVRVSPTGGIVPNELGGVEWSVEQFTAMNGYARLQWGTISYNHKFGDTYYWSPVVEMIIRGKLSDGS